MSGTADWQGLLDVVLRASIEELPPSDAPLWLTRAAELAMASVPDTAGCSLTVRERGQWMTLAYAGDVARKLDSSQFQHGTGPCLQAASQGRPVGLTALEAEKGFPEFASAALELGIQSSLSVPVRPGDGRPAALNVYGTRADAFSGQDARAVMSTLTTCVSALMGGADTDASWRRMAARLQPALADRTAIGQAQGVLSATRKMPLEDAYTYLVQRARAEQKTLATTARIVLQELDTSDVDASAV
jgi:hypothetical protein